MAKIAILGYTGFVGSHLVKQLTQEGNELTLVNSKNLWKIEYKRFDKIYCACMPGVKWKAIQNPEEDFNNMLKIIHSINYTSANEFYLVSSQDCNSNLTSNEAFTELPPTIYGIHRLQFESFIKNRFNNVRIMRIGCLFGDGLKKNIIYDIINNKISKTQDITYQLYFMDNLVKDFEFMKENDITLMNRFSEPVWVSEIAKALGSNIEIESGNSKYCNKGKYLLNKEEQLNYLKEWNDRNKLVIS